ncbi:MAG: hypothetical protein GXP40_12280 [Chloroflexi bacterium]|nr:hypothetical protein [Chloroflexota bacterium]
MTVLGITPPSPANPNKRCPYLGMRDDPETALGFPSNWNYCHNAKPVAIPDLEHQRNACLTARHTACPVFCAEKRGSLPKDLRVPDPGMSGRTIWRWAAAGVIAFFLIASGLIFSGYWIPPPMGKLPVPGWMSSATLEEPAIGTTTPVVETDTPRGNTTPDTPTAPTGDAASATQTEPASTGNCAHPLETPIGTNRQFLLHRVTAGESMAMLAEDYETTEKAIGAVNYFLPSPLWSELVIVIPLSITDVDGLPSLRPVLIEEDDISLEELAQNFSVSSSELMEFNQLDPSCRSFYGWMLIPAEKNSP